MSTIATSNLSATTSGIWTVVPAALAQSTPAGAAMLGDWAATPTPDPTTASVASAVSVVSRVPRLWVMPLRTSSSWARRPDSGPRVSGRDAEADTVPRAMGLG